MHVKRELAFFIDYIITSLIESVLLMCFIVYPALSGKADAGRHIMLKALEIQLPIFRRMLAIGFKPLCYGAEYKGITPSHTNQTPFPYQRMSINSIDTLFNRSINRFRFENNSYPSFVSVQSIQAGNVFVSTILSVSL